jgi:hypothetical protein
MLIIYNIYINSNKYNIAKLHKNFSRLRTQLTLTYSESHVIGPHDITVQLRFRKDQLIDCLENRCWSQWPVKSLEKRKKVEGRKKVGLLSIFRTIWIFFCSWAVRLRTIGLNPRFMRPMVPWPRIQSTAGVRRGTK